MADEAQLWLHVQVKWLGQVGGFVLLLRDIARAYAALLQMIEYWQTERQKSAMSRPVISGRH